MITQLYFTSDSPSVFEPGARVLLLVIGVEFDIVITWFSVASLRSLSSKPVTILGAQQRHVGVREPRARVSTSLARGCPLRQWCSFVSRKQSESPQETRERISTAW